MRVLFLSLFVLFACGSSPPAPPPAPPVELDACTAARIDAGEAWRAWPQAYNDFVKPNLEGHVWEDQYGWWLTEYFLAYDAIDALENEDWVNFRISVERSRAVDILAKRARGASWRVLRECMP